ncbi:hypothetical protein SAMN05444166_4312 [Singulisphaera sp. GP187]|nr:hypothetical protein SAMN05444166_4312 [Singulisphaera sp. GP187]
MMVVECALYFMTFIANLVGNSGVGAQPIELAWPGGQAQERSPPKGDSGW